MGEIEPQCNQEKIYACMCVSILLLTIHHACTNVGRASAYPDETPARIHFPPDLLLKKNSAKWWIDQLTTLGFRRKERAQRYITWAKESNYVWEVRGVVQKIKSSANIHRRRAFETATLLLFWVGGQCSSQLYLDSLCKVNSKFDRNFFFEPYWLLDLGMARHWD